MRDGARPEPRSVEYRGAASAAASAVALGAIRDADVLLIAPSSPVASIAPILAIPGVVRRDREPLPAGDRDQPARRAASTDRAARH